MNQAALQLHLARKWRRHGRGEGITGAVASPNRLQTPSWDRGKFAEEIFKLRDTLLQTLLGDSVLMLLMQCLPPTSDTWRRHCGRTADSNGHVITRYRMRFGQWRWVWRRRSAAGRGTARRRRPCRREDSRGTRRWQARRGTSRVLDTPDNSRPASLRTIAWSHATYADRHHKMTTTATTRTAQRQQQVDVVKEFWRVTTGRIAGEDFFTGTTGHTGPCSRLQ